MTTCYPTGFEDVKSQDDYSKSTCDLLRVDRLPQTGVRMPYGTPTEKNKTLLCWNIQTKAPLWKSKYWI